MNRVGFFNPNFYASRQKNECFMHSRYRIENLESYEYDFNDYKRVDFERLDTDTIIKLRDTLRLKGIHVRKRADLLLIHNGQIKTLNNPYKDLQPILNGLTCELQTLSTVNFRTPHLPPSPYQMAGTFKQQQQSYGKELANLAKIYNLDEKLGGTSTESFNYKFNMFLDSCSRAQLAENALPLSFNLTIEHLIKKFQDQFEGEEYRRNNKDLPKSTVFNNIIDYLRQIQRAPRNKIITACNNVAACSLAVLQPATVITSLINNIHGAI
ncbi:hypothetical protein HI914_01804 [Erysiphe necator]|nr:hypothetical protein HI914_01804 [Erysiphe necator]